jgi:hypothetical protein
VKLEHFHRLFPQNMEESLSNEFQSTGNTSETHRKFFWIVEDLDYKEWTKNSESGILVLRAPYRCNLEQAARYIVYTLKKIPVATLPLPSIHQPRSESSDGHGFRRPAQSKITDQEWSIAITLLTSLRQLIRNCKEPSQQQTVLSEFLGIDGLLGRFLNDEEPEKARSRSSLEPLKQLLARATLDDLWVALNCAFTAYDHGPDLGMGAQHKPHDLVLIFNLDRPSIETWKALLNNVNKTLRAVQRHWSVKVLIIRTKSDRELELQQEHSEIIIDYDKERKGINGHYQSPVFSFSIFFPFGSSCKPNLRR